MSGSTRTCGGADTNLSRPFVLIYEGTRPLGNTQPSGCQVIKSQ